MDMENLLHMANQIGGFFVAMPDKDEALLGIATHLHNFWEPRMRKQLLQYVESEQGRGLMPIVLTAIQTHRDKLLPQH